MAFAKIHSLRNLTFNLTTLVAKYQQNDMNIIKLMPAVVRSVIFNTLYYVLLNLLYSVFAHFGVML